MSERQLHGSADLITVTRHVHHVGSTHRRLSPYQQRRREEERLGAIAFVLSLAAAVLFVLITAQAAGFVPLRLPV